MSAMDMFWAAPPVSRTITAATVLLSVTVWMGILDPYYVVFLTYKIFSWRKLPEIWRFVTPFILTGPKLGLLLDPYFLYTYGSQLETQASRFSQPGDFFVYLIFVGIVIMISSGYFLGGVMFLSPLTLALAYTYAQENPTRQLTYFIITFSAKYLPYAMLAMTFVMSSPQDAMNQATGVIAAHAYDFLTKYWPEYGGGTRLLKTPETVQRWFARPGGVQRGAGTAFTARPAQNVQQAQTGSGGGWSSGFGGNGWNNRGAGRRLGGD